MDSAGVNDAKRVEKERLDRERGEILQRLERWLEVPMLVLSFVWLVLLVIELTQGLSALLEVVGTIIWGIFILEFLVKFVLAPHKLDYLKQNWLTVVALVLPALRVFRVFLVVRWLSATRAVRSLQLVRIVTSTNRGMRTLGASMSRRGLGYVIAITGVVLVIGAAGMYAFENSAPEGLNSYGEALWWTAMILITLGSGYWPQTPEGRVLCLLLGVYGFTIFGYVTASLASFFIERDAESKESQVAGAQSIEALHAEIVALRAEVRALRGGVEMDEHARANRTKTR